MSERKKVIGFHKQVEKEDLEIVRDLLKSHLNIEAEIPLDFNLQSILSMTVKALNAQIVVELGTGMGGSLKGFLEGSRETGGHVYSIDLYPDALDVKPTLEKYKNTNDPVTFILGDSITVGKSWDKGDIDILLCDSNHGYEHVLNELNVWSRFNPKVTFVHDTLDHEFINSPFFAAKTFSEEHGKTFVNLTFTAGLGIII